MASRGRKYQPPILSWSQPGRSPPQWGINTNGGWDELEYYNPNPWARILGKANETDVEIDWLISKAFFL